MQQVCKVEIFKRDFTFSGFSPIPQPEIAVDFLAPQKVTIRSVNATAQKGDYAHITDENGKTIYDGIVDDVTIEKKGCSLKLIPLLSIFDVDVFFNRNQLTKIEPFIAEVITQNFIQNQDQLQNVPGLSVRINTETTGGLNLKDNIHSIYDMMISALKLYGIACNAEILPQEKTIKVVIGKVMEDVTIEADLSGIINKNIVIGDSFGQLNKVTIINKNDESQTATYYLHTNGSVDSIDENRITPVFFEAQYIQSETDAFADEAAEQAYDTLAPQAYDNLIELTAPTNGKIMPAELPIGTAATIISAGNEYRSILTGYETSGETTTLIFGIVRVDLTKILQMERRM